MLPEPSRCASAARTQGLSPSIAAASRYSHCCRPRISIVEEAAMPKLADAIDLLHQDHERVQALFRRAQQADDAEFRKIAPQVCRMLKEHSALEENVFYPYVRQTTGMQQMI